MELVTRLTYDEAPSISREYPQAFLYGTAPLGRAFLSPRVERHGDQGGVPLQDSVADRSCDAAHLGNRLSCRRASGPDLATSELCERKNPEGRNTLVKGSGFAERLEGCLQMGRGLGRLFSAECA